jgi:hypothetical protein
VGDRTAVGDLYLATVVINTQDVLYTSEQSRHVDRLLDLGATRVTDWPYPDGADFVVLRDPDGNEFCIIDHVDL